MQSTRTKLIQLLASNKDQYISGQSLSEKLNISRSAIWKHMKNLEKDGYQIEGRPKLGYRILRSPDELNAYTLQRGLQTNWLGKTIIHKDVTTSTQDIAHQAAKENAKHGTVIVADEQTNGKGRMNRTWYSSRGKGIWLSMILRPTIFPYLAPQLTLLTATVLADVIKAQTKLQPQIKWPNDILINDKKVTGILTEMQAEQDKIQYVVIGIGINVNQATTDLPESIHEKATSLLIESGSECNIVQFIQSILETFEEQYTKYIDNGFLDVKSKWESYGYKIGEQLWIKMNGNRTQAIFLGIAEDGALLMRTKNNEVKKIYSAEIEWFKEEEV